MWSNACLLWMNIAMSSLCKVHWLWVSCDMQSALVVARVTCMILCENSIEPLTVSKAVLLQHSTFGRCTFDGMDRIIGWEGNLGVQAKVMGGHATSCDMQSALVVALIIMWHAWFCARIRWSRWQCQSTSDIMADVLSIAWTELLGEKAIWEFYGWTCEHNSVTNWTAQRFLLHTPNIKYGFTGRLTTTWKPGFRWDA